jgi:katanin p80 WD40 repeat-containing subunit B1
MVFHPDGKTLFCGLDQSLKVGLVLICYLLIFICLHLMTSEYFQVFSWEPVRCHDVVDMGWSNLADLSIYEGKLLGCSYHERRVGLWAADISVSGILCMQYVFSLSPAFSKF